MDGIGGNIKTAMYRSVKAGKVVFSNAAQFAEYADENVNSIKVVYVGRDEIKEGMPPLEDDLVQVIPGTLKLHHVDRLLQKYVSLRRQISFSHVPVHSTGYIQIMGFGLQNRCKTQ